MKGAGYNTDMQAPGNRSGIYTAAAGTAGPRQLQLVHGGRGAALP
jgi:hypothetical protein